MPVPCVMVVVATHAGTPLLHERTVPPTPVPKNVDVPVTCALLRLSWPPMVASVDVAAAYTLPFASTPNPELVSEVSHVAPLFVNAVVDAYVANVDDATRESGEPVSQRPLDVALMFCPLYEDGVNGYPIEFVMTSCQLICSDWLSDEEGGGDGCFIVLALKPKISPTRGIF